MSDVMETGMDAELEAIQPQYRNWFRRLRGEALPIHDGEFEAGFWRNNRPDGSSDAVAIWWNHGVIGGEVKCRFNNVPVDPQNIYPDARETTQLGDIWTFLVKRPVSHEDHQARIKAGCWPGEELAHKLSNMPPAENSYEDMKAKIEEAVRAAETMIRNGAALTDDVATTAQNTVSSLASLAKTADGIRVVEKKPHWDKCLEVDGQWNPLVKRATDVFTRLRKVVLQPWHDAQERAKQLAIREAKEAAEKLRREAAEREAAANAAHEEAINHGNTAAAEQAKKQSLAAAEASAKADQQEAVAQTIEATPTRVGSMGRAGHTRTVKETTITDRAAFRAYAEAQQAIRVEYEALDQKHANAFTRAGVTAPGTTVATKKVAA